MARSTLIQTARLIAIGLLLGSVANAAVVQVGDYGLGEAGTVGPEASHFVPLVDSSTANDGAANNITYFQGGGSGWNVDLVTSGLAAPGSTAALELVQGGSGNSGWATTVPSYGLADNWVAQLWFKTPTDTSTGDSKVFFGSDDNNASTLELELYQGRVNVLQHLNLPSPTRMDGFAYTVGEWFQVSLMCYHGQVRLYNGTNTPPVATSTAFSAHTLGDLRLGFGYQAPYGRGATGVFDSLRVWRFDATDSLASVEASLGLGGGRALAPTFSEWGTVALALFLLAMGYWRLRRQRA